VERAASAAEEPEADADRRGDAEASSKGAGGGTLWRRAVAKAELDVDGRPSPAGATAEWVARVDAEDTAFDGAMPDSSVVAICIVSPPSFLPGVNASG
jgi:hypothetical protein